jgi:hypothetical protein
MKVEKLHNHICLIWIYICLMAIVLFLISCSVLPGTIRNKQYRYYDTVLRSSFEGYYNPWSDHSLILTTMITNENRTSMILAPSQNILSYWENEKLSPAFIRKLNRSCMRKKGIEIDSLTYGYFHHVFGIETDSLNQCILTMKTSDIISKYFNNNQNLKDSLSPIDCLTVLFVLSKRKEFLLAENTRTAGFNSNICLCNNRNVRYIKNNTELIQYHKIRRETVP